MENELQAIRKKRRYTQDALAAAAGVGRSTISNIESGSHVPGVDVAIKIARALRVPVEAIFYFKGEGK